MPGAIPTIWCDMRGMPKSDQRGLVQPFIAIMQVLALALLLGRQSLSSKARHRPRDQPAGAVCGFRARHCCIPEHQRGRVSPDHSCAIAVVRRFARLGLIVIRAEGFGAIIQQRLARES